MVAWGLGYLSLGDRRTGWTLLAAEGVLLVAMALVTPALIDGTAYLVPFLLGIVFVGAWAWQAVATYRTARRRQGAAGPPLPHSAAAAVAWLGLPLLAWGTAFWMVAATSANPPAVLDGFVRRWDDIAEDPAAAAAFAEDPRDLSRDAARAIETLRDLCRSARVTGECDGALSGLLGDVRVRILSQGPDRARAVIELVRYERRSTRLLGIVQGAQLVPIPERPLLYLQLSAVEEDGLIGFLAGARRWIIDSSRASLR